LVQDWFRSVWQGRGGMLGGGGAWAFVCRLLRQLRAEATLAQEELVQAAGVSQRSVSDLERASTAPRTTAPRCYWPAR
jgi:hypothetical protein